MSERGQRARRRGEAAVAQLNERAAEGAAEGGADRAEEGEVDGADFTLSGNKCQGFFRSFLCRPLS